MKLSNFINRYSVNKTLRFKLVPQGETLENIKKNRILELDQKREEDSKKVKKMMDEFHRYFIDDVLSKVQNDKKMLKNIIKYDAIYNKNDKTKEDIEEIKSIQNEIQKIISEYFNKDDRFKGIFKKPMFETYLPEYFKKDKEKIKLIDSFKGFTTYFTGFNSNRKNMYTGEGKSTEVAYRIVNQNLPKYIKNCKIYTSIKKENSKFLLSIEKEIMKERKGRLDGYFKPENFCFFLKQQDIDDYNFLIGDICRLINEYNQKNNKNYKMMDVLYKQILSENDEAEFNNIFETDKELIESLYELCFNNKNAKKSLYDSLSDIRLLFDDIDVKTIYIKNGVTLTKLSQELTGDYNYINSLLIKKYDEEHMKANKQASSYIDKRKKELKTIPYYSIYQLTELLNDKDSIIKYYKNKINDICETAKEHLNSLKQELTKYNKSNLRNDDAAVSIIKKTLDSLKEIDNFLKGFCIDESLTIDNVFYNLLGDIQILFIDVDRIYNKTRNYITKKPYSKDKIKITFGNSLLLNGWDRNKEKNYLSTLLRFNNEYYLAIINDDNKRIFDELDESKENKDIVEKLDYKLLPNPSRTLPHVFFTPTGIRNFYPSKEILKIYESETFIKNNKNFNIDDCYKLIDWYKSVINKYGDWEEFNFKFSDTSKYQNISDFYSEVQKQGYKIRFKRYLKKDIDNLVKQGKIYLFKLYNKDYSSFSKGKKNLHTLYFESLFDTSNLKNTVYALNGGGEMFFRIHSLELSDTVIHQANKPIDNKNPLNKKKQSTFKYDIVKDRRFTEDQFFLHIPLTMNFKADTKTNLNHDVRYEIVKEKNNYIIGIDRGERNLLYLCVIDEKGNIVEQESLNIISNKKQTIDYHNLLDIREKERNVSRQEWKSIENIKNLKDGYMSQVVNKILKLIEKYNAIIALEDLNMGFKNSRSKVEKQVYQKFEKQLIDKLNYYVNKDKNPDDEGGLMKAYQLTNKFESFKEMSKQNGIMFYIPAWKTSKIDPKTGFVNMLYPKYQSIEKSKDFINKIDKIIYNNKEKYFEFHINYEKFEYGQVDYKKQWVICTYGNRIVNYRNTKLSNVWEQKEIHITEEFVKLFEKNKIDYKDKSLKEQILLINEKEFYERFMFLLSTTLQMRNSVSNTDIDYIISPIKGKDGKFFDSRELVSTLPCDADANGAYHIALKLLWVVKQLKNSEDLMKVKLAMNNAEWLNFVQTIK